MLDKRCHVNRVVVDIFTSRKYYINAGNHQSSDLKANYRDASFLFEPSWDLIQHLCPGSKIFFRNTIEGNEGFIFEINAILRTKLMKLVRLISLFLVQF